MKKIFFIILPLFLLYTPEVWGKDKIQLLDFGGIKQRNLDAENSRMQNRLNQMRINQVERENLLRGTTATANKINLISLGMTKAEVIEIMGAPVSTAATANVEYLTYNLYETKRDAYQNNFTHYFVRIVDGKVNAYGRRGDFDSTKVPEDKTTIDLNIKNQP